MEEFNLSERIRFIDGKGLIAQADIKEFIRLVKIELTDADCCPKLWMINNLAGRDLI